MKKVRYRLEVDYLSHYYENKAIEISSPIYTLADGMKKYKKAIKEFCVDNKAIPARVHLWKYQYVDNRLEPLTIAKNY